MRSAALVLLVAIMVLGSVVVARFTVWAAVDERAHYAFVQTVAEDRRLPAIEALVSSEVQAITDNTWPAPSPTDPAAIGLAGRNYEAFQPPLYYVAAAPAFALAGDHRDKVFVLRAFDLVLYLAGAGLLWLLAGRLGAAGPARATAWAAGLLVLAWPGLLVRGVTVSNTALEFALVPAFLLAAWVAFDARSPRWLLAAGALIGACLLTKLTLVVLGPTFLLAASAVWRERRSPAVIGAAALPAALLAPWLIDNHARLGTWTANTAAREQQTPLLYPDGVPAWGIGDVPDRFAELLKGSLPQEWAGQLDVWWVAIGAYLLVIALVAATVGASAVDRRRVGFFAAPVITGLAVMTYTLLAEQWDIFLLRYLAPALAPLAVVVAVVASRHARMLGPPLALVVGALWVDMAGAFLFTDVGDVLGI